MFRFETIWTSHPDLIHVISDSWRSKRNIIDAIPTFIENVTKWNPTTFGNIFCKKRKVIKRIQGIQNSPNYATSTFLYNLENELITEYNKILKLEEYFWKLKSRLNRLNDGDSNTKFFHTITLNRRRRYRIIALQDESGRWMYDHQNIKNLTYKYFIKLFSTNHTSSKKFINNDRLEYTRE